MRHLRHIVLAATLVGLSLAVAAPFASAQDSQEGGARVVAPTGTWDGTTAGEMLGEAWYRVFSLPVDENPFFGNGDPCWQLGRTGGILFNASIERPCTVKRGTPVLINGLTTACTNADQPPSLDEAAQRACALAGDESAEASVVTIDGRSPVDVRDPRYGVFSPQRKVKVPAENGFGIAPRTITFTAHGWMAFVVDLAPGLHEIRSYNTFLDGSDPYVFSKFINVVR
jgi:hypothetical protein